MKRIELIGPSNVGKTTLYNKIIEIPVDERPYLTLKEAYKIGAINQDIPIKDLRLWLYQMLLKLKLFDSKSRGIGKTILHYLNKSSIKIQNYEPFTASHIILLEFLRDHNDYEVVYKRVISFIKKVEEYLILKNALSSDLPVLVDEGVVQKHPGITDYGVKNYSAAELKDDLTFNPAGLISCQQSADVIFQQAIKGKKNGIHTFTYGSINRKELREYIDKNVKRNAKKVANFKEIGIPVLHIDTGDAFEKNLEKINDFTHSIISDNKTLNYLEN